MYSAWNGGSYSGPALYFGRGNGNGWFTTTTKGMFFFSGIASSGIAENIYFSAYSSDTASAANSSLVLEADTKKVLLGGIVTSESLSLIQVTGGVYVKDQGIELASSTPSTTTNKLYNVGGALTWNGSSVLTQSSLPSATSTATEIKLLGFDNSGNLCVWTWHVGTAAPTGTPASTDLAFVVTPA
jgi:hypothetical protein